MLASSRDGGNSWSGVQLVIDRPGDVRVCSPAIWVDPAGRLWWFYHQSYRWWDGRAGVWAITCDDPDAPNPRWSAPRRLADGWMMNKPTVLSSGEWLFPIAIWSHAPARNVPENHSRFVPAEHLRWDPSRVGTHVYRSRDRGATLELLGTAKVAEVRFDEHMIVERKDGSLWMLIRTNGGIAESVSRDRGRTWSEGKPSEIPHAPSRFFIRRLKSGALLLVKHNPPMDAVWLNRAKVHSPMWRQRSHLTAYLSDDDGQNWSGGLLLDDRLAISYPDGDEGENGEIFVVYDFNRHTDKEILLARFTEAEVRAGRRTNPNSRLAVLVHKATGGNSR